MIITITDETSPLFDCYVPPEILHPVHARNHFCLGAIMDGEDGSGITAGVLIFDLAGGESDGVAAIAAVIRWLYVGESYRGNGVGDELMEEFSRIINDSEVEHVLCDIPVDSEYDVLTAFMESWNFQFGLTDKYEIRFLLGEAADRFNNSFADIGVHSKDSSLTNGSVLSMDMFSGEDWDFAITQALNTEERVFYLPPERSEYEPDVSCAYVRDNMLCGLFLVRRDAAGQLNPVFLQNFTGKVGEEVIYSLVNYGIREAEKKYGSEIPVYIDCATEHSADLIAALFPDRQPPLVRRGICSENVTVPDNKEP